MRLQTDTTAEKESTCVYVGETGHEGLSLQLTIQEAESAEQITAAEEIVKKYVRGTIEAVEGVGDAAWVEKRERGQTLHVRKKNFTFLINAERGVYQEPSYEEMRRLAQRVADKL